MKALISWVLIIILYPIGIHTLFNGSVHVPDLCPEIENCGCRKDYDQKEGNFMRVVCNQYSTEEVLKVSLANVTRLTLFLEDYNRRSEPKLLHSIRKSAPNLEVLSLSSVEVQFLDLGKLPDGIQHVSVKKGGLKEIGAADCAEENRRLRGFWSLYMSNSEHIKFTCVPQSLNRLVAIDITWQVDTKWPQSLNQLKVNGGSVKGDPFYLFQNIGSNLTSFWVTGFHLERGMMPSLPKSEKLEYVAFQHSNISKIAENAFLNRSIRTINLGNNELSELNAAIPSTTQNLRLYWNQFKEIPPNHWKDTRLTSLNLDRNFLKFVPLGLPRTLQKLSLDHNRIATCSPEAFFHLKNLTKLILSSNRLTKMPTGIQPSILWYDIRYNMISSVPGPQAYRFCGKCFSFNFDNNKWFCDLKFFNFVMWITSLPTITSSSLFYQRFTGLTSGKCSSLPPKVFSKEYVDEASNYTAYIERSPFHNCSYEALGLFNCTNANLRYFPKPPPDGIRKVTITGNRLLKVVPDYLFAKQSDLKTVILEENSLSRIPYGLPVSLKRLSLSNNNISELSPRDIKAFRNLTNLKELLLHDNHIKQLLSTDFEALTSLEWLGADNNEFVCDCRLHSFVIWYEKMNPIDSNYGLTLPRYAKCAHPPNLRGRQLHTLGLHYNYGLQCVPSMCYWDEENLVTVLNCSRAAQTDPSRSYKFSRPVPVLDEIPKLQRSAFWRSIILSDLELEDDDVRLKQLTRLNLVNLTGNRLTKWPIVGLPTSVETLILRANAITRQPNLITVNRYLPNLKSVDLRDNKIASFYQHELRTILSLKDFQLSGNPLECNCFLTALVTWVKAENTSLSNDRSELLCHYPRKLNGVKLRDLEDDEFCEKAAKLSVEIWVACAISPIVLILIAIVITRVAKRRQYKAQILEGIQKLLQEEASFTTTIKHDSEVHVADAGESLPYDAFVAAEESSRDAKFLDELIQELEEKRKHRLCVSIRDFAPGIDAAENIATSIRNSKRVILLMSASFAQSPWCQYGVQVALAELHQRQKKLLIPIILDDLKDDAAPGLTIRTFISMISTYKAPKQKASQKQWEKFWNTVGNLMN